LVQTKDLEEKWNGRVKARSGCRGAGSGTTHDISKSARIRFGDSLADLVQHPTALGAIERRKAPPQHRQESNKIVLVKSDQPSIDDRAEIGVVQQELSTLTKKTIEPMTGVERRNGARQSP
jgi:hypothetical protein